MNRTDTSPSPRRPLALFESGLARRPSLGEQRDDSHLPATAGGGEA